MSDHGWKEEFETADKYDKRRRMVRWLTICSIVAICLVVVSIGLAINQVNNKMAGLSTHKNNDTKGYTDNSGISPETPVSKTSSGGTSTPTTYTTPQTNTTSDSDATAQIAKWNEQNKTLRRQWVGDALKLSSELSNINYLIGLGDTASLTKANSVFKNVTSEAILLGILAGLPDSTESQLKTSASQLAIKAQSNCYRAILAAESINEGFIADLSTPLGMAKELSSQFAQKIQDVKSYQGW